MIGWLLLGCGGGTITTTTLPEARVGDVYGAAVELDGRLRGRFAAEGLPAGLTINPLVGTINGVPTERGDFDVTVTIESKAGDVRDDQTLTLTVSGGRRDCDRRISGAFLEPGIDPFGNDLLWDSNGWRAVPLPLPSDDVEELRFLTEEDDLIELFVTRPGVVFEPGRPIFEQADRIDVNDRNDRALGWDTTPHLGALQAVGPEPTLIIASRAAVDYELTTACVAAPVVTRPATGPFRLGDVVSGGFSATKYRENVTYEALDPLPEGIELSERGGLVGTAEVPGQHVVRIRATRTTNGAQSDTTVGFGIWEPVTLDCDETVVARNSPTVASPFFEVSGLDRNIDYFTVLETPWSDQVGLTFEIAVDGEAPTTLLAAPTAPIIDPFSSPDPSLGTVIELGLSSWPPLSYYQAFARSRLVLVDVAPFEATVTLTCDRGPRPDRHVPPVLDGASTVALDAIGGSPPYTWQAARLPEGVTVDPDGTLRSDGRDFGAVDIDLWITDAEGVVTTTTRPLFATTRAACGPDAVVVSCDTVTALVLPRDGPTRICLPPSEAAAADYVAWRLDATALWGVLPPDIDDPERDIQTLFGDRVAVLDRGTGGLGDLNDFEGRPLSIYVQEPFVEDDSTYVVCPLCGEGPPPLANELQCPL